MIIAIFVAGEDYQGRNNEFPLYQKSFYQQKEKDALIESYAQVGSDDFLWLESGAASSSSDLQTFVCFYNNGVGAQKEFAVFAVEKTAALKEYTQKLKDNQSRFESAEARKILEHIASLIKNVPTGQSVEVYLFSHWHASDPLMAEQTLNEKLNEILRNEVSGAHGGNVHSVKTFALSSLRDDLFNLKDIKVPLTYEGIRDLIDRFEEDGEYYDPNIKDLNIKLAEAIDRFLFSNKYAVGELKQRKALSDKFDLGCKIQNAKFVLVATNVKWPKWPIIAIKDVLSNILRAHGATVCEYGEIPQDESQRKDFRVVPIFINDKKHRGIGSVAAIGACPPPEFVLDCEKGTDNKWNIDKVWETLRARLEVWDKDGTLRGVSIKELSDWMAGAFRKYCFLDERAHGMSGDMNLTEVYDNIEEFINQWIGLGDNAKAFREHFQAKSQNGCQPKAQDEFSQEPDWVRLIRQLFQRSFERLAAVIKTYDASNLKCKDEKLQNDVREVFCLDVNGGAIVSPCGLSTRFSTPSTTIRVLLIDDKAKEECTTRLTVENFPGFEFTELTTEPDKFSRHGLLLSISKELKRVVNNGNGKISFDVVLLDLCLDGEREDPSGYQLIPLIRGQMPNVPIIVYSQFDDMGHEKRAFDEGAAWFLKKSEYRKFARHLDSIFRNPEWKSEWDAVSDIAEFGVSDFTLENAKDDLLRSRINNFSEYAYLIYRALRTLPGKKIYLKRIENGYGGAMTVKAWKGDKISSPTIVKIDSRFNTVMEYERYFRFIRPFLANECGRIENPAISIDNEHSVVVYTYAGCSNGDRGLTSLKDMLQTDMESPDSCSDYKYAEILKRILDDMLPRIHDVDEGDNGVFGEMSSFPNPALDEVPIDEDYSHISDNYVCRLPLQRWASSNCKFVSQKLCGRTAKSYVFHGGWKKDDKNPARIELYDESKRVIALSNEYAEHILAFRNHLIPGSYVWVDGMIEDNVTVNNELLNQILMDVPLEDFDDAQQGKIEGINGTYSERRSRFGKLIELLMGDDHNKTFRALSQEKFKSILDNLIAGNWEFYKQMAELLMPGGDVFAKVKNSLVCPRGIVHGDMNLGNIMVDGASGNFSGIWFIDFARTRRDYIVHDFNVLFTSILSLLFCKELWSEKSYGSDKCHSEIMKQRFADLVQVVVFRKNDGTPKLLPADSRVRMIYSMLRQIRASALKDHKISLAAYAYTTALMCLVTSKVVLQQERNLPAAAGMIVAAAVCCEELLEGEEK